MPAAIPLAIGLAASAASVGAIAGGVTIAGIALSTTALSAISVGLTVAGTLAQTLLAPQPPKPKFQDGSQSIKQAVPPRTRCYGRYRLAGAFIYYRATESGDLHTLVCHAAHRVDAFEDHWLNDEVVTLDGSGFVDSGVYNNYDPILPVRVWNYLGTPTQSIIDLTDEWTAGHDGKGLACTHVRYADMKPDLQQKVFPSGAPAYRATLRGAMIYDPRQAIALGGTQDIADETTWAWSDNAALVLLDYMTRHEAGIPVGFGLDIATNIDVGSFAASATICDQAIPRKAHDPAYPDEKRWRAWGAYDLTEDRKSVLSDMLDACSGRLTQAPDGRLGLSVGAPNPVAAVTIDDDQILEYDLSAGKAAIERVNEVRATYVSQDQDWAETEAGIQQDQDSIDRNGTESSGIKLRFVPSEGQAQRVARFTLKFGNPSWSGKVRGTLALLDAWGERWVRLQIAELEIDQVFEISGMSLNRDDMSVTMNVTSYDGWWDWDPATDEADPAPIPEDIDDDDDVPVPAHVVVSIEHRPIDGRTLAAIGVVSWDAPPRPVFVGQVRYRPVTTPTASPWQFLPAEQDEDTASTPPLINGQGYEAQARFLAPRGSTSDWSASTLFTAVADPTAPAVPPILSATPSGSNVLLSATAGNSANQAAIRFWRDSDTTFAGAVDISGPLWTFANAAAAFTDTPGPGAWRYWATAENWSGVQSAPIGPQAATLTPAAPVIVSPTTPFITSDNTPTFSGTGPNGTTVHLFDGATDVGSVAVSAGAWIITASVRTDGTRTWKAVAVAPGPVNSADSNTVSLTIDTVVVAPVITTSSPLSTTDTTPDISGTSEAGAHIDVYRGGSTLAGTATADGSGNWTSTLSTLAIGTYSITAKQTDLAGNLSGASSPAKTLNIQPVAPAITTTSATTYDTTPTIVGTSTASATIKLYDDGVVSATTTADGSGNWTHATGVLATGANVITATQTVSGIESPASSGITMTITALDTDAAAYIAAMTVEPNSARMGVINTLVTALKTAGVWTKLDALYLLAAHDAQAARLNVRAPASFALTANSSPTFTTDRGYTGTGHDSTAGGFLSSTFNPTTAPSPKFLQNDAHMMVVVRTASSSSTNSTNREIGNNLAAISTKGATAGQITTRFNDSGAFLAVAAGTPNSTGFFLVSRAASTGYDRYHAGTSLGAATVTSAAPFNDVFNLLRATTTTYSDAQITAASWGGSLTSTQEADFNTAVQAYLTAVGA